MTYILPCHPSAQSLDPLGICDSENPTAWEVIIASIQAFLDNPNCTIHQLPSLIHDLSYSIKMHGSLNTDFLAIFLLKKFPDSQSKLSKVTLSSILNAALALPTLFPANTIQYLGASHHTIRLSSAQIMSLLAHQILNTLSPPPGNTWGCTFACWYSEPQALEKAVFGYLATLFEFFTLPDVNAVEITYRYNTRPFSPNARDCWKDCTNIKTFQNLVIEPVSAQTVPFPHATLPCTLVASNKSPGFGPACTQEELVTAACPPLLPLGALLIAPPVPTEAVIVAHGYVPLAHWQGQGRKAFCGQTFTMNYHTFLFLDAAELDQTFGVLPDLEPEHLLRDLHKAYMGFSTIAELGIVDIASPLWGAGSFGGDPVVKTLILSMAAARAGVTVHLSVDEERHLAVRQSMHLIAVLGTLKDKVSATVGEVFRRLESEQARRCIDTFELLHALDDFME